MKICAITPDRNDRPEFIEHCKWQMERQTRRLDAHFIINYPAEKGVVDIVPRIKKGIDDAINAGFDACLIIENDDYYPDNYVNEMSRLFYKASLIGISITEYYSLEYTGVKIFNHPGRASLFCSGFLLEDMKRFVWPSDKLLYLDLYLWKSNLSKYLTVLENNPLGIKHGLGFSPGNYHNKIVNGKLIKKKINADHNLVWLTGRVRSESFEFYKKIIHENTNNK